MKVSGLIDFLQLLDPDKEIVVWYDQWQKQVPDFELIQEEGKSFYAHIAI